jgi:hypothetical protein
MRTALCAVRCSVLAARAVSGGVSNPPVLRPLPSRGRPGGLLTPPVPVSQTAIETLSDLRAVASALFVAYSSQIAHGMHCTFDADSCFCTRLRRPSHDQRRAVLDV